MRKLLSAVAVILMLTLASLPPLFGLLYERQLREQFADLPVNPYLIVELADYDRGLYASRGRIRLAFTDDYLALLRRSQAAANRDPELDADSVAMLDTLLEAMASDLLFDIEVQHGPFLPGTPLFLGLAIVAAEIAATDGPLKELQGWLGVDHLLRSRSRVAFDGSQDFELDVPPASVVVASGDVAFSGLHFQGHFDPSASAISVAGGGNSLVFDGERLRVEFRDLAFDSDSRLRGPYLWLGNAAMALRELNIEARPPAVNEQFFLDGLGMEVSTDIDPENDQLSVEVGYHLAGLTGMPGLDLQASELRLRLTGIDAAVAERYAELNQQLALADPEKLDRLLPELLELADRVLSAPLTVQIDPLRFRFNGEDFDAGLRIDYLADELPAGTTLELLRANPGLLLLALAVEGRVQASEGLANDIVIRVLRDQIAANLPPDVQLSPQEVDELALQQGSALLDGMRRQGILREEDGRLRIEFSYREGQFLVNGQPLALGQSQAR